MPLLPFAGHEFRVAGGRALYLPARRALIVADLHLEKASWFAARGQMLPPHDCLATLETLAALVTQTEARESARHKRRLRELHDQRQKLVQLY